VYDVRPTRIPTTDNWAHLVFVKWFFFGGGGVGLSRNIVEKSGIKALIFSYQTISSVTTRCYSNYIVCILLRYKRPLGPLAFTVQRSASAVYAVIVCPSVCLSICLSVCHKPALYHSGYTQDHKQRRTIAQGLYFTDVKVLSEIQTESQNIRHRSNIM